MSSSLDINTLTEQEKLELRLEFHRRRNDGILPLRHWASVFRANLRKNRPFDLSDRPYMKAIYDDTSRRQVYMKAAQEGLSELMVSLSMYVPDELGGNVLYIFPTERLISDFSAGRMGPAIEASKHLTEITKKKSEYSDNTTRTSRVTLRQIGDAFLYLRGGKIQKGSGTEGFNAPQLESIDADCVIRDEVDRMDARIPAISAGRLLNSQLRWERDVSTPTLVNMGIHTIYMASDMKQWHVPCPSCGKKQTLEIENCVTEFDSLNRPVGWHQDDDGPYIACTSCGSKMDRFAHGEWVAEYPDRDVSGYLISKLFSPSSRPADSSSSLSAIIEDLQDVDETRRQECWNKKLGKPYSAMSGQRLTQFELDRCSRDYGMQLVPGEECYMGVDIGKVHNVVIRGRLENGERPTRLLAQCASLGEVERLITEYAPKQVVIDANPYTEQVRAIAQKYPRGKVLLCYYTMNMKSKSPVKVKRGEGTILADRTRSLDSTLAAFRNQEATLPGNGREIKDYYSQMQSGVRKVSDKGYAEYISAGPDHYLHAENYCNIATMVKGGGGGWSRGSG